MEDLRNYRNLLAGRDNLRDRIDALSESMYAARTSGMSDVPTHDGGNHYEDKLIDDIVTKKRLKVNDSINAAMITMIERGLSVLCREERIVLERWYILPKNGSFMEDLKKELFCEKSKLYDIRDAALRNFTIAMYGITEL